MYGACDTATVTLTAVDWGVLASWAGVALTAVGLIVAAVYRWHDRSREPNCDLSVVSVAAGETDDGLATIDCTVRNRGREVVVLKGLDLKIRSTPLKNCGSQAISKLVPSATYDLLLRPSTEVETRRLPISQEIAPNSADRFVIVIDSAVDNVLYEIGIVVIYNEKDFVVAGTVVLLFEDLLSLIVPDLRSNRIDAIRDDPELAACVRHNIEAVLLPFESDVVIAERVLTIRERARLAKVAFSGPGIASGEG